MASSVSYAKIFPPIGIARVGNSDTDFFVGPEAPGIVSAADGTFKDARGRIKRQAARFRVYGFADDGTPSELTLDHPEVESITWTAQLANKKADWFRFGGTNGVADIVEGTSPSPPRRRNASVQGDDRAGLMITPSADSISGRNRRGNKLEGTFRLPPNPANPPGPAQTVYLGELRTDEAGRLLVLGGLGTSGTVLDPVDNPLASFANNDGWFDDTSDGPVSVVVKFKDGTFLKVVGRAWVICAPPHFSPHTQNIVNLYDVMSEAVLSHNLSWNEAELGPKPDSTAVSFARDIYPVLERLTMYQWTSARAKRGHAPGRRGDFLSPDILNALADPETAKRPDSPQKRLCSRLRTPILHRPFLGVKPPHDGLLAPDSQEAVNQANLYFMPPLSGDEGDVTPESPTTWLSLTETQYGKFMRWKSGDFLSDLDAKFNPVPFEQIPVKDQPTALTLAALESCQGGAFFPGIEITSIVRFASFYSEAFRVSDDYVAGDITKWMALPWQADFYDCSNHWWPSVRPDDVVPVGELERLLQEFADEVSRGRVATLLENRKRWDRGVGRELPPRPALPVPVPDATASDFREHCSGYLSRQRRIFEFFNFDPDGGESTPQENEGVEAYRRRVEEFLLATVFPFQGFSIPPVGVVKVDGQEPRTQTPSEYFETAAAFVASQLDTALQVPEPLPDESLSDFATRVAEHADGQLTWQGLFDYGWRFRESNRGKNDFVSKWSRMGFVVPRTAGGQTVYVEADRKKYDLMKFREYFYHLVNIEQFPDFVDTARELAFEYMEQGRAAGEAFVGSAGVEQYTYFAYDEVTFAARLEKIYNIERAAAEQYNPTSPVDEPIFRTPEMVVERIRQLAPFNQMDGSWLEKMTKAGPINEVNSFMFEIWSDEIGNGDPAQNHANVYTDLMHSAGIYVPPISSRAYADNPDLWDANFSSPAYQAAVAYFPETFYPELLGMTLYLEWEAVFLPAMVKLYEYYGYPSLFYRLHVAIDNTVNGHGAHARDAVKLYLDHIRDESGEQGVQEHFRRIWTGYLAFRFGGFDEWVYRYTNPPPVYDRMLAMVEAKRHYGQLNHALKRFGVNSINDLFDEPDQFLAELASSDLIVRGDPKRSPIFALMNQTGPMLKVFTQKEKELWSEWISSLPKDPVGAGLTAADAMLVLLKKFTPRGIAVPEHATYRLTGDFRDPQQNDALVMVDKSVSWWFQIGQPDRLMAALAAESNGWVIPKDPGNSRLVKELIVSPGRMAKFLAMPIPELGGKPARNVIIDWIADGCQIPGERAEEVTVSSLAIRQAIAATPPSRAALAAPEDHARVVRQSANAVTLTPEQIHGLRTRFYGTGAGAPH